MSSPLPDVGTQLVDASRLLHNVASRFHDEQPCRFDQVGFCQEHMCEPPCRNAMLRLALAHFPIEFFATSQDQVDDQLKALGNPKPSTENLIDRLGVTLEELLMVNRHMLSALQQMAERGSSSSVEIKTSARGQDVSVKAYVGSDVQAAGEAAVGEYTRIVGEINQRLTDALAAAAA